MKTSFVISYGVAAVMATLGCIGLAAAVPGVGGLFGVSLLLLIRREEFTRPIPRGEWWCTFLVIGIFLAVFLTFPFLHLPDPGRPVRIAVAVPMWLLWMWAIYRHWRKEKRQADA